MPDGKIVTCYAKTGHDRIYGRDTFETITFHPHILDDIAKQKKPTGIFIDSTSDLLGNNVKAEHINMVIHCMNRTPQHIYFVLTKNPRRLLEFEFPQNALVGLSAPPTFMYGKELTPDQQQTWFKKGTEWLASCSAKNVWLSLEPLSIDVSETIRSIRDRICWAVIGAGSDYSKKYQPSQEVLTKTWDALDCPVFFKGNLDRQLAHQVCGGWYEDYPELSRFQTQAALL